MTTDKNNNKQEIEKELKAYNYDVASISFKFNMTRDEAKEVLKGKSSKTSREFTKYFRKLVETAARRFLEVPEGEDCQKETIPIK